MASKHYLMLMKSGLKTPLFIHFAAMPSLQPHFPLMARWRKQLFRNVYLSTTWRILSRWGKFLMRVMRES
jgi:hypothetical protein